MKRKFRFDKAQKKYFADLLKSVCLIDLAGVGYQYINGSKFGMIAMTVFAILVTLFGILLIKGTDEQH